MTATNAGEVDATGSTAQGNDPGRPRRRLRPGWWRRPGPYIGLALLAWLPLFRNKWGTIGADTKVYLYLDPGRLMKTSLSMWDPNVGMGTVTHQTIGYLFPMGPYYWLMDKGGVPDWVAQRLWLGFCLFAAGAGVVYLLRTLGWKGAGVVVAAMAYLLSPYFLDYAAKHSVIALPWSGLPWLLAFTIRSIRHGGWRDPALFALTVQLVGGVNAPSLALVGVAALLWIPYAIWVNRECSVRRALGVVGRIGAITTVTSLWWIAGLYAQSGYGIAILKYTETARTVANASTAPEVLRGLGYWFFYGGDKYGNFVDVGGDYTQRLWLLGLSFLIPTLALVGVALSRFRERAYFVSLILVGTILSVGAHPWNNPPFGAAFIKVFLEADIGLAVRSLPRAVPLIALGMAVMLGALVTSLRPRLPDRAAFAGIGVIGLLLLANNPPLFNGGLLAKGLSRPNDIPTYWKQDIAYLDTQSHATRVLEVPGADFASYRWGTTVDPITPGLMDRPYVARELIPYGSPPSAELLNALDAQMQESTLSPKALAPMARFMAVGDINVRNDLTYERYGLPRPALLWKFLNDAPGLGDPVGFGGTERNNPIPSLPLRDETELEAPPTLANPPKVGVIPVKEVQPIVRAAPSSQPVVIAGDGEGLIDTSASGLLNGSELVFYSASFSGKPDQLRSIVSGDASLVLTDTNRRRARRWGTVRDNTGLTERPGQQPLQADVSDNRLPVFPDAGDNAYTVAQDRGGVQADATGYGDPISYTPENRPANAVDATGDGQPDLRSAWRVGGFSPVNGEKLELRWDKSRTASSIHLVQATTGVRNRFITKVGLSFDGGPEQVVDLGDDTRTPAGGTVQFPQKTFKKLDITVRDSVTTEPGVDPHNPESFQGISAVGFADVEVGDNAPKLDEVIRLPKDLLDTVGARSQQHPLAIVLTRLRTNPTSAVRTDEETQLKRTFSLPTARSFSIQGQARLSAIAPDGVLDGVLGLPDAAAGGVDATGSRRLPGDLGSRASSALDGDPATWWSPGFLGQQGEYLRIQRTAPVSFDHLDLSVLADGRHSTPTRIRIDQCHPVPTDTECHGTPVAAGDVPAVTQSAEPNHVAQAPVHLDAPVTSGDFQVVIDQAAERQTRDWYSGHDIAMPVGIADLGIPGLHVARPGGPIDPKCRSGLLTVDGRDVAVSLRGSVADALAGNPIDIQPCGLTAGLPLAKGAHTLRTAPGLTTGINLDQLSLRSAAGGRADTSTSTLISPNNAKAAPKLAVTHQDSTSLTIRPSRSTHAYWLAFGQSHNLGWTANADGKDLGQPTLLNGYGNGWKIPAGTRQVKLQWTPQKIVNVLLWASVLGGLVLVALILWPMRHRLAPFADEHAPVPIDPEPSRPRPVDRHRVLRYAGARPGGRSIALAGAASLLVFGAFIGVQAGVIAAVATVLAARYRRARPLLTVGGPALLLASAAYIVFKQHQEKFEIGFEWPAYFSAVHQVAWMAVAFLTIDVVVDRLWLRRWWPTDESPS